MENFHNRSNGTGIYGKINEAAIFRGLGENWCQTVLISEAAVIEGMEEGKSADSLLDDEINRLATL